MRTPISRLLLTGLFAAPFAASTPAVAATVAYWRFENGAFTADTGGNNLALNVSSGISPSATQIAPPPSTGNGSAFFDPVPRTNDANTGLLDGSGGWLTAGSDARFALGDTYTVEFVFNRGTATAGYMISQWGTDVANRAFGFGLGTASGTTYLRHARNGSAANLTEFAIASNTDYYFGFAYDNGNATVYFKDLTNNGALQSFSLTGLTGSIGDSNASLLVGNLVDTSTANQFNGLLDEIRLSNTTLGQSDLLVTAIPEPSAYAALLGLLSIAAVAHRRRR